MTEAKKRRGERGEGVANRSVNALINWLLRLLPRKSNVLIARLVIWMSQRRKFRDANGPNAGSYEETEMRYELPETGEEFVEPAGEMVDDPDLELDEFERTDAHSSGAVTQQVKRRKAKLAKSR